MYNDDASLGGAFAWAFWFLGELAFKWGPATVATAIGTGVPAPPGTPDPITGPVTHAVSAPEVVQYLQLAAAPGLYEDLFHRWSVFVALSMFVSLLLTALIIYCGVRIFQLRQVERRRFASAQSSVSTANVPQTQLRWQRVVEQAHSDNEHSWRLAILEADIMLNELLDVLGYKGETMADKMRTVERGDFNTIDLAWEAHKIRNKVAHEGTAHVLSAREARRVIELYERVFKEFKFIT